MNRSWAWFERVVLLVSLLIMAFFLTYNTGEILGNADPEAVDAFTGGFWFINLSLTYLLISATAGYLVDIGTYAVEELGLGPHAPDAVTAGTYTVTAIGYAFAIRGAASVTYTALPGMERVVVAVACLYTFVLAFRAVWSGRNLPLREFPTRIRGVVGR